MDQAELESLVIRLVGDVSGYVKAMDQAVKHTEEAATKIEHSAAHVEKFHVRLKEFGERTEKTLLRVGLAVGAWEAFEKADHAEQQLRHLEAAVELNTVAVEHTIDSYKKWSKEIAATTPLSKSQAISVLAVAESFGITGDRAERAAKDAIALAAAVGGSAEQYLRLTKEISSGNFELGENNRFMLKMIPQLRGIKDEAELLEKYQKLISLGQKIMTGDMEDASGQVDKMKQAFGGLTKEIGQNLAPIIEFVSKSLTSLAQKMSESGTTTRYLTTGIFTLIGGAVLLASTWGPLTVVFGRLAATWTVLRGLNIGLLFVQMTSQANALLFGIIGLQSATAIWTASLYALGGVTLIGLVAAILSARKAMKEYNEAVEDGKKLTESLAVGDQKRLDKQIEHAKKGEGGVRQHIAALEELMKVQEKELKGQQANLKNIKEEPGTGNQTFLQRISPVDSDWVAYHLGMGGMKQMREDQAKIQEGLVDRTKESLEKLKGQIEQLKTAGTREADEYINQLNEESSTLGMNEMEVKRYKLALAGLNEEKMQEVVNAQEANRLLKEEEETRKKVNDILKDLEMESYGFDEEQMLIYKLAMAGASQETIDYARALHQGIDAQKEWDDYLEEAAQLTEKYKDPMLKRLEAQERYSQMLKDDVITIETYNAAMDDLIEKTHEVNNANQQAALSGSQESLARIAAYQDMLRTPIRGTDGASARGGLVTNLGSAGPSPTEQRADVRAGRAEQLLTQIRDRLQGLLDGGGLLLTPGA